MRDADEMREFKEKRRFFWMSIKLIVLVMGLMLVSPLVCPSDPFQIIRATMGKVLGMVCALILIPGGIIVLDWQWKGSIKGWIDEGNIAMALVLAAYMFTIGYIASWI